MEPGWSGSVVVTRLDRPAQSLPAARTVADELTARQVRPGLGGGYDPPDPVGRLLFNVLEMVAEFDADLIRLRTRKGHPDPQGEGPPARQAAQA